MLSSEWIARAYGLGLAGQMTVTFGRAYANWCNSVGGSGIDGHTPPSATLLRQRSVLDSKSNGRG